MGLVHYLQEIIMSDGLGILSIFCFYMSYQLSGAIFLCKKSITSENKFELTSVISFGHIAKGVSLGLGFLFLLHFLKLSGEDLGQAFKSLFNTQKGSDGSGANVVKFVALIMTVISGLVLSIAHKQVEKLDKELETIREKSETAVSSVDNEIETIKKEANKAVDDLHEELNKIKKDSKNEKNSLEDLKVNLSHISSQNVAIIELNKLIQQSKNITISDQKPDFEIFGDLIGYNFDKAPPTVIIDAIDSLSKKTVNKEWFEDNFIFGNYIRSLYQQFSRIGNKNNEIKDIMKKIEQFVPESIFSLNR